MDAVNPQAMPEREPPPFELRLPDAQRRAALIFASPHSGRVYPQVMMAASGLDSAQIRRSEDALVDELIGSGVAAGAAVLTNRIARAFVDVNRAPYELDPDMFEDQLPEYARGRSARVAAGLGAIARIVGDGCEIYRRKLTFAEARDRIEQVHAPYHQALTGLIEETRVRFGHVLVIDWHSMPSAAARNSQGDECDFVLGDRYGCSCDARLVDIADRTLSGLGYRVARNAPYAGGYTTEHYGQPEAGVHVLQVEINRRLYLDEASLSPGPAFAAVRQDLERLFAALALWRA